MESTSGPSDARGNSPALHGAGPRPSADGVIHSPAAGVVESTKHVLGGTSIEALGRYIVEQDVRKILVLLGAGVSVAAGIPDFRSPNTGLYANLEKYDLEEPSDAFSLTLLRESPAVFYTIANEMNLWPGAYQPTTVHHFVKLLSDQGRLLRCCTQNIDGLERAAGVPAELLVEAHGSFRTASCIDCHRPFDIQRNRREAKRGSVSHCDACGGIVKPDVVFFGEQLPERFFHALTEDTQEAELVLVIGTSLQVRPFALLPLHVSPDIPRVLINRERVGGRMFAFPDDDDYLAQMLADKDEETESTDASQSSSDQAAMELLSDEHDGAGSANSATSRHKDAAHGSRLNEEADCGVGGRTAPSVDAIARKIDELVDHANHVSEDRDGSTSSSSSSEGFLGYEEFTSQYKKTNMFRDVFFKGDCQRIVSRLATAMGLKESLSAAVEPSPSLPIQSALVASNNLN